MGLDGFSARDELVERLKQCFPCNDYAENVVGLILREVQRDLSDYLTENSVFVRGDPGYYCLLEDEFEHLKERYIE